LFVCGLLVSEVSPVDIVLASITTDSESGASSLAFPVDSSMVAMRSKVHFLVPVRLLVLSIILILWYSWCTHQLNRGLYSDLNLAARQAICNYGTYYISVNKLLRYLETTDLQGKKCPRT
jgi:hypothetical protein